MRFEYGNEANALYIYLRGKISEGGAARTVELSVWSSWTLRTSAGSWSETAGVLTSPRTSGT
jgi:hypothetical protein